MDSQAVKIPNKVKINSNTYVKTPVTHTNITGSKFNLKFVSINVNGLLNSTHQNKMEQVIFEVKEMLSGYYALARNSNSR